MLRHSHSISAFTFVAHLWNRLWDTSNNTCTAVLKGHSDWVHGVVWSEDAHVLSCAGNMDKSIKCVCFSCKSRASCTDILSFNHTIYSHSATALLHSQQGLECFYW